MKKPDEVIADMKDKSMKYRFFDANCWLPGENEENFFGEIDREEFLGRLSSCGIEKAVVSSRRCYTTSPFEGNENLVKWTGACENLYAGVVLAPEAGYSPHDMRKYIDGLIDKKAVLARVFPRTLGHSLKKWQMDDIFRYLEHRHLPLMIWHMETDWDTISEICAAYPGLAVIVEGNDRKLLYHNRSYIRLMKSYPNLYIETHNFVQYLGYEYIITELGIDRLVFGSYFPYNDPNAAIYPLVLSDMDDDVRNRIAAETLEKLVCREGIS